MAPLPRPRSISKKVYMRSERRKDYNRSSRQKDRQVRGLLACGGEDLGQLFDGLVGASLAERVGDAGGEMLFEDDRVDPLEGFFDRHRLLHDVDAVFVFLDHALDGFEVPGHRAEAAHHIVADLGSHGRHPTPWGRGWGARIGGWPRISRWRRGCGPPTSMSSSGRGISSAPVAGSAERSTPGSFPRL